MNGKMDLSGVEGLADLIDARTPVQLHQAWAQIDGALRAPVMTWRAESDRNCSAIGSADRFQR